MTISVQDVAEIVKTGGLVAGGLWTAWTFHRLQRTRAAEVENNRQLAEIQRSQLEQQELRTRLLRQQPQPAIDLSISEAPHAASPNHCLRVTVTVKNEGDQNLDVHFDRSTLIVGRIVLGSDGGQTIRELHRSGPWYFTNDSDEPQALSNRVFRVGQRRQLAFAVPIRRPGVYFVQFYAVYSRVPFDGEDAPSEAPSPVAAIEQTIHFTTGNPIESTCT
jgi:hypothetical protein